MPEARGVSTSWPTRPGSRSTRSGTTPAKACSNRPSGRAGTSSTGPSTSTVSPGSGTSRRQRFSLAAIRALLNADRPGLEGLFASQGSYSLDDLVEKSGLEPGLVGRLREIGLLAEPEALGHEVYDDSDLGLLRVVVELQEIGMTEDILVELGAIYVRHFRALQKDVHAMLAGEGRDWDPDEMVAVQRRLTANSERMIPAVDRVLNYVHQRTIQRLTLEAVRTAQETNTGVGGVRLETPRRSVDARRGHRQSCRSQMRAALPPVISARSVSLIPPIMSSMVLREYGQSLPWCG